MYTAEDALVELAQKAGSFMVILVDLVEQGSVSTFSDSDSMNSVIEGLTKYLLYYQVFLVLTKNFTER